MDKPIDTEMNAPVVYKILDALEWRSAVHTGSYRGSADDIRDGFIHLSTADQVAATLLRHFAGRTQLVIVAFDSERLGETLRWEPSRGGQMFPHVYGDLPVTAAIGEAEIVRMADGSHQLPRPLPAASGR